LVGDRHRVDHEEWFVRRVILIGAVVAMAATACGDIADEAAEATATAEAEAADEVADGDSTEPSEGPSTETDPANPEPGSPSTTSPEGRVAEEGELPDRVPPTRDPSVTGEADAGLVAAIREDLISRTGASESDIVTVRSEEVIWNDGSLGCPVPGEMYTQALVSGYWVVLEYGGTEYDYRANDRGLFRLCEGLGAPPSNPTG
jgi:hypothetical protein